MGSAVEYCGNFSIWGNVYVTALLNEIAFILFCKYFLCWRAVWRKGGDGGYFNRVDAICFIPSYHYRAFPSHHL